MAHFSNRPRFGNPGRLVALGFLFLWSALPGVAEASRATVIVGGTPAVVTPPTPTPPPLHPDEGKKLLKEFQKAQKTQLKAADHRQDLELKELKNSQKARIREWETKEKELRHAFFKEHSKGPDRRTYIQDFLTRRK